jgi:hypothetical protein
MVFNAHFNNISVISWRSVSLVEEIGGPGENHRPVESHWQTISHNVVNHENLLYISVGQYCLWNHTLYCINFRCHRVAVIVWLLDLQLPMHSVYITTDVVNSNLDQGEVYNIMWYSLSVTFDRSVVFSGSSDFLNDGT